ncbi:MAG: hypothetical protein RL265_1027 [Bacteroidota bacterium]
MGFALGIAVEILLFFLKKRLERKARPEGKRPKIKVVRLNPCNSYSKARAEFPAFFILLVHKRTKPYER